MFHLSSLHCWPFHFSFTFHKIIISAQRRFHNQVKPSLMSPRCITWTCGFVAQLIVAPNYYLGGRDWIPWKPEFLRLLFWNRWKLQLTCEHHSLLTCAYIKPLFLSPAQSSPTRTNKWSSASIFPKRTSTRVTVEILKINPHQKGMRSHS